VIDDEFLTVSLYQPNESISRKDATRLVEFIMSMTLVTTVTMLVGSAAVIYLAS